MYKIVTFVTKDNFMIFFSVSKRKLLAEAAVLHTIVARLKHIKFYELVFCLAKVLFCGS